MELILTMRPSPAVIIVRIAYLVSTMGETGIEPHQLFDIGIVHVGEQSLGAQRGIVDQAIEGAMLGLHLADQFGDHFDTEIDRRARN